LRDFIADSPEFVRTPNIKEDDFGKFFMIVVAANFSFIPDHFQDGHDREIIRRSVEKMSNVFDVDVETFARKLKDYRSLLNRVNMPSKNMLYAMSKAIFVKYELNEFQEDYFRSLKTPNPIFLKNLDEITKQFVWDWNSFSEKYKIVEAATV
jgi:hypothetical protein